MYHVCHINSSAGIGGGEKYLLQLARHLHGKDFRFSFILPEEGVFCAELSEKGLPYQVVPMQSKSRLRAWSDMTGILQARSPDLVHCHGARASWYGRIAARRARCRPLFSTVHNSLKDYPHPRWKKAVYLVLERSTAHLVDQWIAVSRSIKEDLVGYYGYSASKIEVIANGVDPQELKVRRTRAEVLEELGIRGDRPVILHAARMTRQKGHAYLLSALGELGRKGREVTCLLAGDGPCRRELEEQAAGMQMRDRILFLGFRSDICDLLAAADLFVLPSLSEGMPIGLLEAMALGSAVVATAVSGIREIVSDRVNGLLVPSADAPALARALEEALDDHDLRLRLSRAAADTVREKFTAEKMARQVAALYHKHLQ